MNAAFSEIQDGAFSHLPLLQFLYGQGLAEGQGRAGEGKELRLGGGEGTGPRLPVEVKLQVSLTSSNGRATVKQRRVQRAPGAAVWGRKVRVARKSKERGCLGPSWEWTCVLWRPQRIGCSSLGCSQRVDSAGERGRLRDK